jgi:hypothetical protein
MSVFKRTSRLLLAAIAAVSVFAVAVSTASAAVVYNNIPSPLPGNLASFGNEAYSMSEFGGMVEFASPGQKHQTVTVAMSTWACQYGNVYPDTCETPKPTKKFKWPLTLNVYEVGAGNSVGAKLATITKTFRLPYRPTRDTTGTCVAKGYEAGTWYDSTTNACYHGMAFPITFKKLHLETRKKEIISVSYNTTDHGPAPVGPTACNSTVAGCYYDSLNIGIIEPAEGAPSAGSDPTNALYINTTYEQMYCGSSTPVGTFGPTAPIEGSCAAGSPYETEAGIQPALSVSAE